MATWSIRKEREFTCHMIRGHFNVVLSPVLVHHIEGSEASPFSVARSLTGYQNVVNGVGIVALDGKGGTVLGSMSKHVAPHLPQLLLRLAHNRMPPHPPNPRIPTNAAVKHR